MGLSWPIIHASTKFNENWVHSWNSFFRYQTDKRTNKTNWKHNPQGKCNQKYGYCRHKTLQSQEMIRVEYNIPVMSYLCISKKHLLLSVAHTSSLLFPSRTTDWTKLPQCIKTSTHIWTLRKTSTKQNAVLCRPRKTEPSGRLPLENVINYRTTSYRVSSRPLCAVWLV